MEADTDSTPALTDAEARSCGRYLAADGTFAVLTAAAVLLGPRRSEIPRLAGDKASAQALAEFVLAADQRAGVMRELADHVDRAATLARVALMQRADYAELMTEVDTMSSAES